MKITKQKRLQDAFHFYYETIAGRRPVTMDEVAAWAIEHKLFPVPGVRDSAELGAAWDARFERVKIAHGQEKRGEEGPSDV
jgi:hypothetical protein